MKHNKLFKGITATALALTVPMSMLAVGGLSVTAAEIDETEIMAGTKIYFDVESAGWKNYRNIYCHIWRADGTGVWPSWQTRKELCVNEDNGLYSYDVTKTGNADEIVASGSHNYYCVIFSADTGAQTYSAMMNGDCLGDTCYVTGKSFESPEDSEKRCYEMKWRNHPECGAQKVITSTGRVVGTTLADGTTDVTLLADFLLTNIDDYGIADTEKTDHTTEIVTALGVSYGDVLECVQGKLAASVASGYRTQKSADLVERTVIEVLEKAYIEYPEIDPYDINGDGTVDVQDVTALQLFISGQPVNVIYGNTDVNTDGKLDVQDVTALQIQISGGNAQPEPDPEPVEKESYNREFADRVIELVNAERAKEGLSPLAKDETLTSLSEIRSKETVTLFSHDRPDGKKWSTILTENNVPYLSAAENLAAGQNTPEKVVQAWMDSAPHRASIMSSKYNKIGVSCYVDQNSEYVYYWEQLFVKDEELIL